MARPRGGRQYGASKRSVSSPACLVMERRSAGVANAPAPEAEKSERLAKRLSRADTMAPSKTMLEQMCSATPRTPGSKDRSWIGSPKAGSNRARGRACTDSHWERKEGEFVVGGVELTPSEVSEAEVIEVPENGAEVTRELLQISEEELREVWPDSASGQRALFLDYDGTLREFEARPDLATPNAELSKLLAQIDAREDLVPHIISGRDANFLETHFGRLQRFTLIAEHGFQIKQPKAERAWQLWEQYRGDPKCLTNHDNWKAIMKAEMERLVELTPGSHLEEKQSSLVWHYREVPDEVEGDSIADHALGCLEALREEEGIQDVKISHGHKVVEVSYRNVRKGLVMRRLCEEKALFGEPYAAVLAAGDDVSDETMFDAAPRDFLTIKVGSAATLARFRVDTPQQLRRFLREKILA